jgi:hypothetical protein
MLASPVLACPTEHKVAASILTIGQNDPIYTYSKTHGDIEHFGGIQVYFNILTLGQSQYPIYSYNTFDTVYNTKTGMLFYNCDSKWYITDTPYSETVTANGFSGKVVYSINLNDYTMTVMAVTHGFGAFRGQTLVLSYRGPIGGAWTGFCIN